MIREKLKHIQSAPVASQRTPTSGLLACAISDRVRLKLCQSLFGIRIVKFGVSLYSPQLYLLQKATTSTCVLNITGHLYTYLNQFKTDRVVGIYNFCFGVHLNAIIPQWTYSATQVIRGLGYGIYNKSKELINLFMYCFRSNNCKVKVIERNNHRVF